MTSKDCSRPLKEHYTPGTQGARLELCYACAIFSSQAGAISVRRFRSGKDTSALRAGTHHE